METVVEILESDYIVLLKRSQKLTALESAGVDNWEGYPIAMEMLAGEEEGL